MKKITIAFLTACLFAFALPVSATVITPQYVNQSSQTITQHINTKGSTLTLLNGDVRFGMQPGALTVGTTVTFSQVDESFLNDVLLPAEYKKISKIFMYEASTKPQKPLWLTMNYASDLKFTKFMFIYDEKNQNWKNITSKTNLEKGMVSTALTGQKGILLIADTDVMKYGKASWYKYKGCMCAASPDYPKGSKLLVVNKNKNQGIVVTVNDWGPERDIFPDRVIDLDLVAFTKLGTKGVGVFQNIYVTPYHASDFTSDQAKTLESAGVVNFTKEELAMLEGSSQKSVVSSQKVEVPAKVTNNYQPTTNNFLWLK
ncbi:hypothetical protein IT409_01675 [Candidatus Falkowbacteria bacterium]|nr:hypothetical protein [Candidatus Falkowbacteria bacterium]